MLSSASHVILDGHHSDLWMLCPLAWNNSISMDTYFKDESYKTDHHNEKLCLKRKQGKM